MLEGRCGLRYCLPNLIGNTWISSMDHIAYRYYFVRRFLFYVLTLLTMTCRAGVLSEEFENPAAKISLVFVQKIPFLSVVIGNTKSELEFDSGGMLGLTLAKDVITILPACASWTISRSMVMQLGISMKCQIFGTIEYAQ